MAKMLSFQVENTLAKDIDRIISNGAFSSRSEFLKDAVRKSIEKEKEMVEWRKNFDKSIKKLREEALAKGWNGKLITKQQRVEVADEWLKKRGMRFNHSKDRLEKIRE
jgi:Arc/MetJ-type ribon-helix-helix transcriptional regulator